MPKEILNTLTSLSSLLGTKTILAAVSIIAFVLIIDAYIPRISILISNSTNQSLGLFVVISCSFIVGQFFILGFAKQTVSGIVVKERNFNLIKTGSAAVQYVLVTLLLVIILEMSLFSFYSISLVIFASAISYSMAIIIMILLGKKLISWFRARRNYVLLWYGLSSIALCINAALLLSFVTILSFNLPAEQAPQVGFISRPNFAPGLLISNLNIAYSISSITSFAMTWVATSIFLSHYSRRFGRVLFWVILSLPLLYFFGQFIALFLNPFSLLMLDPVSYASFLILFFLLSKPVAGILFGIAFWDTARKLHSKQIRNYLILAGAGLMLFFISIQAATIDVISYPPFGLPTALFTGLSSYLIIVGLYSSAISLSQDITLRREIKRLALKETTLIESIAAAQLDQQILNKVMTLLKDDASAIYKETGVQSSLREEDMKQYLDEVLKEMKRKNTEKGDNADGQST